MINSTAAMPDYAAVSTYRGNGGRVLGTHHEVVEGVPWYSSLGDHSGCYGWAQGSAKRVKGLQEALDPIGVDHVTSPSTPSTVFQTIAEAGEQIHDNEDRIGRMKGDHEVGDEMACRGDDRNSSLTKPHVECAVAYGGDAVAQEWREEDQ